MKASKEVISVNKNILIILEIKTYLLGFYFLFYITQDYEMPTCLVDS